MKCIVISVRMCGSSLGAHSIWFGNHPLTGTRLMRGMPNYCPEITSAAAKQNTQHRLTHNIHTSSETFTWFDTLILKFCSLFGLHICCISFWLGRKCFHPVTFHVFGLLFPKCVICLKIFFWGDVGIKFCSFWNFIISALV